MDLTQHIRDIPDFPTPGILFRDITPLLHHPPAFRFAVDMMAERIVDASLDSIVWNRGERLPVRLPVGLQAGHSASPRA